MNTRKIKKALQPAQQEGTSNFSNSSGMKRNTDGHALASGHCSTLSLCKMPDEQCQIYLVQIQNNSDCPTVWKAHAQTPGKLWKAPGYANRS